MQPLWQAKACMHKKCHKYQQCSELLKTKHAAGHISTTRRSRKKEKGNRSVCETEYCHKVLRNWARKKKYKSLQHKKISIIIKCPRWSNSITAAQWPLSNCNTCTCTIRKNNKVKLQWAKQRSMTRNNHKPYNTIKNAMWCITVI